MSTTHCATVILRMLVRSRVAPVVLTVLNVLLDTSHLVTALVVALAGIAVALGSQTWPVSCASTQVVAEDYRATNAASSACTS
jgi:hypothetical protein